MRYLWIFTLSVSHLLCASPSVLEEFPLSSDEICVMADRKLQEFDAQSALFLQSCPQVSSFAEAMYRWNKAVNPLFQTGAIFAHLSLITQNSEVVNKGLMQASFIQKKLQSSMDNPKIFSCLSSFAKDPQKQKNLTPYERYTLYRMLQTAPDLQKLLSSYPMQPFLYAKGEAAEKSLPENHTILSLSWNVCLLDYNLSMLFGGVLPWRSRIEPIIQKIIANDPDIICLQEVFASDANEILVEKLRSKYSHFYYKIGPSPIGFSVDFLGIPSGLFVASKYPLKNASFTPYTAEETPKQRSYGFFSVDIYNNSSLIGRLITTHLQPGNGESDIDFRRKQCAAIHRSLQLGVPTLLCGDFNIQKESAEAGRAFAPYAQPNYEGIHWTCCELRDFWWKAKESVSAFLSLPPDKEWLDYFLYFPKEAPIVCASTILSVNNLDDPASALSDHQIVLTKVKFPSLGKNPRLGL